MLAARHWSAALVIGGLALVWPRDSGATPPGCDSLVIDDALAGVTLGDQQGGTLDANGFTPAGSDPTGSIVWELDPPLSEGCVEFTVQGIDIAGVGEHDLLELFTGPNGSFSDGNTDFFLLLKVAGDVYPEVEGELKVEIGEEFSALEVGAWSSSQAWDPNTAYTLAVRLDGTGVAEFYRDDQLLGSVDYNTINAGNLAFLSLRIPNDGNYQTEPPLSDLVFTDVRVFNPDMGGTTDTGGTGDTGAGETAGETGPDPTGGESWTTAGTSTSADTSGEGGEGDATGMPFPPGQRSDDSGCSCRTTERGGFVFLALVLIAGRRRRTG